MTDQKKAAAEAAAQAAAFSASATYERGWEDGVASIKRAVGVGEAEYLAMREEARIARTERDAETTRADNAERMVAELRRAAQDSVGRCRYNCNDTSYCGDCEPLISALSSTTDVAGRWVLKDVAWKRESDANARADRLLARVREVEPERDAAIAARDEAVRERDNAVSLYEAFRNDGSPSVVDLAAIARERDRHMVAAVTAERARDEVGIQLAAAQERLRLADVVVSRAAALAGNTIADDLMDAVNAYRAVPGDALAPCLCGELAGRCPRHDALATDAKGVE